jgi:hypothetical protein
MSDYNKTMRNLSIRVVAQMPFKIIAADVMRDISLHELNPTETTNATLRISAGLMLTKLVMESGHMTSDAFIKHVDDVERADELLNKPAQN